MMTSQFDVEGALWAGMAASYRQDAEGLAVVVASIPATELRAAVRLLLEMQGDSMRDATHPDDRAKIEEEFRSAALERAEDLAREDDDDDG